MWQLVTATLGLPLVVVILDKSCQLLCLRVLVVLERNQCSAISIDEIEESQGLFYRQIEGDTHFMFEDESGLLYAYLKTPDDCIHGIIPFQSALLCCGFRINPSEMISFAILLQSFVHLRRDVPDNRMKVLNLGLLDIRDADQASTSPDFRLLVRDFAGERIVSVLRPEAAKACNTPNTLTHSPTPCLTFHRLLVILPALVMYQKALIAKLVLSHLEKLLQLCESTERSYLFGNPLLSGSTLSYRRASRRGLLSPFSRSSLQPKMRAICLRTAFGSPKAGMLLS